MSDNNFPTKSSIVARMMQKNQPDPNAAFPAMLHRMLTDIDELSNSDAEMAKLKTIVSWQDHGRAFKVHDKNKFISIIMPAFFVRLKYTSFIRQLNTYNFKRVNEEGEDKGALYHENFIRGCPELTANIPKMKKRKSNAGVSSLPRTVSLNLEQQPSPLTSTTARKLPRSNSMPLPQLKTLNQVAVFNTNNNALKNLMMTQSMMKPTMSSSPEYALDVTQLNMTATQNMSVPASPAPVNQLPPMDTTFDLFGGSNWLDSPSGSNGMEQNYLQRFLDMAAAQTYGSSNDFDDCNDYEPVPISPMLDSQIRQQQINNATSEYYLGTFPASA